MKFILSFLLCLIASIAFAQSPVEIEMVDSAGNYNYEENDESVSEEFSDGNVHTPASLETLTSQYQEEQIHKKKFDEDKYKQVVGTTDYNEKPPVKRKEEEEKVDNRSQKEDNWEWQWNEDWLRNSLYTLAVVVLVFLVYSVLSTAVWKPKAKTQPAQPDDLETVVENIDDLSVTSLLQKAIAEGNFRLAARLYYLDLLKQLNAGGIINWKKEKTNRDYLTEVFARDYHFDDIRKLTLAYESAWYGEHALTSESFQQLADRFEAINQKLNTPTS